MSAGDEHSRARRYATRLVARRAYSRRALADKIVGHGFGADLARRIVDDLARVGVLDDDALAESLVEAELSRRPAGRALLEKKLLARGISGGTAQRAVQRALEDRDLVADAAEFAHDKASAMPASLDDTTRRRRLYAALARRGFDPEVCRVATEDALGV